MSLHLAQVGVALPRRGRLVSVIEDVSLSVEAGETLAIVGESGSGKTTLALAIPRLLPPGAVLAGRITLEGQNLAELPEQGLRKFRGARIGMVFQDPLAALNPAMTVGAQIGESIRLHLHVPRRVAAARAVALLDEVGIANAAARAGDYPHMFSGGMRQRVMIAAALACGPSLLIADEPTSGLDRVVTQQFFRLLDQVRAARRLAVLLISHDIMLMARHADRAAVFYAGRCVEIGPAADVLRAPLHRYTRALLRATPRIGHGLPAVMRGTMPEPESFAGSCRFAPRCDHARPPCSAAPPAWTAGQGAHVAACLYPDASGETSVPSAAPPAPPEGTEVLQVSALTVRYRTGLSMRAAVERFSFSLARGECLGVVGASGSGKTSLARAILHMIPYEGRVQVLGQDLAALRGASFRAARRRVQMVFQSPAASLDPLQSVADAIGEALQLGGLAARPARRTRAAALLAQVGLPEALLNRIPATLSGGQAQRVAIARALAAAPDVLVLDEPTASLDMSTASGLLALLRELAVTQGLAYIVITHDLAVASVLAHRLALMQDGQLMEIGPTAHVLRLLLGAAKESKNVLF